MKIRTLSGITRRTLAFQLEPGDVEIRKLTPNICEDCENKATRIVTLDLRNNGMVIAVGQFCGPHAKEVASRLRESLSGAN